MEAINEQIEVRNAVSDIHCMIDEMSDDKSKLEAIQFAIDMMNGLKEQIKNNARR